jgi:phage FluMu protein Com
MSTKLKIRCKSCNKRLGVPAGLHIIFICPECKIKQELFFTKVFTPAQFEVNKENGNENTDFRDMALCENKIHHHFLIILN